MKTKCLTACLLILFVVVRSVSFGQEVTPKKVLIADNVALHYIERGNGQPIIFVHGLLDDYSSWRLQVEGFARNDYRAIAYSRRHNYPNKNLIRPNHSASLEADDLAAFIRKLDLKKTHVVGFSYGAYTALFLALKYPDLVQTVTLAEPPIAPWLEDLPGDQAAAAKAQLKKLMSQGVDPARTAFKSDNNDEAIRAMMDAIGGKGKFDAFPDFVKQKCRRNISELKAFVASDDRYPDVDRESVRQLAVPTLIVSGGASLATSRFTDPELIRLIPAQSRKQVVFQGASHIMWIEQPVRFRETILEFIREE